MERGHRATVPQEFDHHEMLWATNPRLREGQIVERSSRKRASSRWKSPTSFRSTSPHAGEECVWKC